MAGESYFGSSPFGGVRRYQSATVTPSVSALYMKTLNDSILQTRMFLDEVTPADWQDAQVIREINVGYHRVYTGVIEVYEDYYVSQANITTQLNKQEYTVSDGFPVDFYKMRRVEMSFNPTDTTPSYTKCVPASLDSIRTNLTNNTTGLSIVTNAVYYLYGNTLGFLPYPTQSSQAGAAGIKMWYVYSLPDLSSLTDQINIPYPNRYYAIISKIAAGNLLRKGQQEEKVAARYLAESEQDIVKMQEELRERISDGTKSVVDTLGEFTDFDGPQAIW